MWCLRSPTLLVSLLFSRHSFVGATDCDLTLTIKSGVVGSGYVSDYAYVQILWSGYWYDTTPLAGDSSPEWYEDFDIYQACNDGTSYRLTFYDGRYDGYDTTLAQCGGSPPLDAGTNSYYCGMDGNYVYFDITVVYPSLPTPAPSRPTETPTAAPSRPTETPTAAPTAGTVTAAPTAETVTAAPALTGTPAPTTTAATSTTAINVFSEIERQCGGEEDGSSEEHLQFLPESAFLGIDAVLLVIVGYTMVNILGMAALKAWYPKNSEDYSLMILATAMMRTPSCTAKARAVVGKEENRRTDFDKWSSDNDQFWLTVFAFLNVFALYFAFIDYCVTFVDKVSKDSDNRVACGWALYAALPFYKSFAIPLGTLTVMAADWAFLIRHAYGWNVSVKAVMAEEVWSLYRILDLGHYMVYIAFVPVFVYVLPLICVVFLPLTLLAFFGFACLYLVLDCTRRCVNNLMPSDAYFNSIAALKCAFLSMVFLFSLAAVSLGPYYFGGISYKTAMTRALSNFNLVDLDFSISFSWPGPLPALAMGSMSMSAAAAVSHTVFSVIMLLIRVAECNTGSDGGQERSWRESIGNVLWKVITGPFVFLREAFSNVVHGFAGGTPPGSPRSSSKEET